MDVSDREMELLLGVVIALYTFSDLSLGGKTLDFIRWSKSKLSVQTYRLPDDSMYFFVLRAPECFSDSSITRALQYIRRGMLFVLGPEKMGKSECLVDYLNEHGNQFLTTALPLQTEDRLSFSFANIPNAGWHRAGVTATIAEMQLMQLDGRVWGVTCFIGNLLLISHSPLDIIRLFSFIEPIPNTTVYLTKEDRVALLDYKGCIAEIPDADIIEASLLRFQHEQAVFYVLTAPKPEKELVNQIGEITARAMPRIASVVNQSIPSASPANSIVYDSELNLFRCGTTTEGFESNAILVHEFFEQDPALKELLVANARDMTLCLNILGIEHYASIDGYSRPTPQEMYDVAIRLNPDLLKLLRELRKPSLWSENRQGSV